MLAALHYIRTYSSPEPEHVSAVALIAITTHQRVCRADAFKESAEKCAVTY